MSNRPVSPDLAEKQWTPAQAYVMAGIFLVVGLALGYLFRGSESLRPKGSATAKESAQPGSPAAQGMPSLDRMKQMADKQAEPLLEKLKADPNNPALLNQVGTLYKATHQFKEAAAFYEKALAADPKNLAARTDLASCLYYQGEVDAALGQLQQALQYDPKDANSLFNLGMIRWQGKNDANGAVSAWRQLLQANPALEKEKKSQVEKLIAQAKKHSGLEDAAKKEKE